MEIFSEAKMNRDEILVKLVENESIIWKRNHPQFKNITMKEQAWERIAFQLGITTTEAERRFKSIREKYRRRKILLERNTINNVEHSKLKRWDLYDKLSFLDDFMIPRNGNESLGMLGSAKAEYISSENISSTNEISIFPVPNHSHKEAKGYPNPFTSTSTPNDHQKVRQQSIDISHPIIHHLTTPERSQSTPIPSTTTANLGASSESHENVHFDPIIKMEVPDDDDSSDVVNTGGDDNNECNEPKADSGQNGNFNYVGDYIAAELNKLPLRDAFELKNILIREVLKFSEKVMLEKLKQ